jgi:hypothetical protein
MIDSWKSSDRFLSGIIMDTVYNQEAKDERRKLLDSDPDRGFAPLQKDYISLNPNEKLNELLTNVASKLGFGIEFVNAVKSNLGEDVVAATNFFTNMVSIAKDKNNKLTIPEEVGHIVIAALKDNVLVDKLMELARQSQEYAEVVADYSGNYNNNEQALAFEAAGKIFSKVIVNEYDKANPNDTFWQKVGKLVRMIFDKFLSFFNRHPKTIIQDAISETYGKLAKEILAGNLSQTDINRITNIKSIFYQKEVPNIDKFKDIVVKAVEKISAQASVASYQGNLSLQKEKETSLT